MTGDRRIPPSGVALPQAPRPVSTSYGSTNTSLTQSAGFRPVNEATAPQERSKARLTAGALDALIRSVRTQNAMASGTVGRTFDILMQDNRPALHIEATALRVEHDLALTADEDHGRWLLPAFMAGLRRVRAQEDCRAEDLHALALELSALKLTPRQLEQFADWLWSDGLEGFDVEMHTSFAEVLDVTDDPARQKLQIAAVRAEMAMTLASDVQVTVRDLDAASLLQEFQTPLDAFAAEARSGRLGLSAEEADELRKGVDESAFWVRQEITLALAHPALRKALPPGQVARSLVRVAAESFDNDFMGLVAALSQHTDDYARAVVAALENEPVGDAIAERAPLDEAGLQRLLHLLTGKSAKFAAGIARGLCERSALERAKGQQLAEAATTRLAMALGIQKFVDLIDVEKLSPNARTALASVAVRARADVPVLAGILGALPASGAMPILAGFPGAVLSRLDTTVARLLREASPRDRTGLAQILLAPERGASARPLVEVLVETWGMGWELRTVRLIAEAAVRQNCAAPLVAIVHHTQTPVEVRLPLLDVLAQSPQAEEVLKWRFAELMDADAIRLRLVELRKERKS